MSVVPSSDIRCQLVAACTPSVAHRSSHSVLCCATSLQAAMTIATSARLAFKPATVLQTMNLRAALLLAASACLVSSASGERGAPREGCC